MDDWYDRCWLKWKVCVVADRPDLAYEIICDREMCIDEWGPKTAFMGIQLLQCIYLGYVVIAPFPAFKCVLYQKSTNSNSVRMKYFRLLTPNSLRHNDYNEIKNHIYNYLKKRQNQNLPRWSWSPGEAWVVSSCATAKSATPSSRSSVSLQPGAAATADED